ncbi:MAG: hypothetical protein IPM80_20690 [Proteobacteria bacterium]|nr:hypothetical protein [Pseudomonadota bacterium]
MNLAAKLPPAPLMLPATVLALACALLVTTLWVQGRALRDSAVSLAPRAAHGVGQGDDAPLPATSPAVSLTPLAASDLFGRYDPAQAAAASTAKAPSPTAPVLGDKAPDSLPDATVALRLQGIIFKRDPARRRAIIAGDGPNAEVRKVGDEFGGVIIRYIEQRRVVVEQQGELKALRLPEAPMANGAASFSQMSAPPMPGSAPEPYVEEPMEPQYEAPPEDFETSEPVPEEQVVPDDSGDTAAEPME